MSAYDKIAKGLEEALEWAPKGAKKFDSGKIRMELIPTDFLEDLGEVLTFGAEKYGVRNWELGMDYSRVYGALLRHLNAWWSGKDQDEESGMSHLSHAAACITFLMTYESRGVGNDDRQIYYEDGGEIYRG